FGLDCSILFFCPVKRSLTANLPELPQEAHHAISPLLPSPSPPLPITPRLTSSNTSPLPSNVSSFPPKENLIFGSVPDGLKQIQAPFSRLYLITLDWGKVISSCSPDSTSNLLLL